MALTSGEKGAYTICLILTILLVGLHISVAVKGYQWAKEYNDDNNDKDPRHDLILKETRQELAFIVTAAGLTFFISLILLIGLCTECISAKTKHVLATFNLILEFALAVVIALRASNNSNFRHVNTVQDDYPIFELYYKLSISDAVITFALQIVYLIVIYFGTLREVVRTEIVTPVVVEVPPLSNRQF